MARYDLPEFVSGASLRKPGRTRVTDLTSSRITAWRVSTSDRHSQRRETGRDLMQSAALDGLCAAELPIVQTTKFEFVINLNTVKSLGLIVPPGPLSTVDAVIE